MVENKVILLKFSESHVQEYTYLYTDTNNYANQIIKSLYVTSTLQEIHKISVV